MSTRVDMTGRKFGRYTAVEYLGEGKWKCICECGSIGYPRGDGLRRGTIRSCGCLQKEEVAARQFIDIRGQKFSRLTVLEYTNVGNKWKCKCDCGNFSYVVGGDLRQG